MTEKQPITAGDLFFPQSATKREQTKRNVAMVRFGKRVRGMILYPCCRKEAILVLNDARGNVSCRCPRCGQFADFDLGSMTASVRKPIRGASERYKDQNA